MPEEDQDFRYADVHHPTQKPSKFSPILLFSVSKIKEVGLDDLLNTMSRIY